MSPEDLSTRRVANMLDGGPFLWCAAGPRPVLPATTGAVVETSGSTGGSRKVVLTRDALLAAARSSRSALGLDLTWHLALPSRYVAGLMVLVRSLAAGRQPVSSAPDLADLCPRGGGDAVSIVATQLHRALADPALCSRLAGFDVVLVGGSALAPKLRSRAQDAGIRVRETYGMSETCGGVVWDGHPLPGVAVEVRDVDGAPQGHGRIVLGGPTLCEGYLDDRGAIQRVATDGMLATSDWGRWDAGRLVVGGRLDDVVITGGVNVDLAGVRRAVELADPSAAVLSVPDAEWGSRIVLFATEGSLAKWRKRLSTSLPREALPRQVVIVDEVPRTAGGKPDRATLLAWVPR